LVFILCDYSWSFLLYPEKVLLLKERLGLTFAALCCRLDFSSPIHYMEVLNILFIVGTFRWLMDSFSVLNFYVLSIFVIEQSCFRILDI